jgi:hypothetical protein
MNYSELSDEALLALYKDSDSHAYKEIYLRYWKPVFQVKNFTTRKSRKSLPRTYL